MDTLHLCLVIQCQLHVNLAHLFNDLGLLILGPRLDLSEPLMILQLLQIWSFLRTRRRHSLEQLPEVRADLETVLGGPLTLPDCPELFSVRVGRGNITRLAVDARKHFIKLVLGWVSKLEWRLAHVDDKEDDSEAEDVG